MNNFIIASLLTISFTAQACANNYYSDNSLNFRDVRFEVGYSTGKFISIDQDYAEIGLFAPVDLSNNWVPFLDTRGYRFNDGKWGASAGLGLRKTICDCNVLGVNGYYDYLRVESKKYFHRAGIGLEWLNCCFDVRVNGYIPFWRKSQTIKFCSFDQLGDGFFATRRKIEYAYTGFDAEIGKSIFSYCNLNAYAAAGPYYFYRRHHHHFWGGYGRLELDWKSIVSMQVRVSYDHVYKTEVQGIFQISIPLDFFCPSSCNSSCACDCSWLATQPVRRTGVILTDDCCNWSWNW